MVCGRLFATEIMADGSYTEGHYFGTAPVILEDVTAALAPNQHPTEYEIWECNDCHEEIAADFAAAD